MNTKESFSFNTSQPAVPASQAPVSERRGHVRFSPSVLSAMLFFGEERYIVSVGDISFSGAKIHNAPPGLREGDAFQLATCLQDRDNLKIRCTVAHANGNEAQSEVGVRFDNVEDAAQRALISYLRHLLNQEVENTDQALAS